MIRKLGKFLRLPGADKALFFKAILLSFAIRITSRTLGFNATVAFLQRFTGKRKTATDEKAQVARHLYLLKNIQHFPNFMVNCLSASTTFWWLLKRRGIDTQLRFGVMKEAGKLKAHAWLEYQGVSLTRNPAANEKYTMFKEAIL